MYDTLFAFSFALRMEYWEAFQHFGLTGVFIFLLHVPNCTLLGTQDRARERVVPKNNQEFALDFLSSFPRIFSIMCYYASYTSSFSFQLMGSFIHDLDPSYSKTRRKWKPRYISNIFTKIRKSFQSFSCSRSQISLENSVLLSADPPFRATIS